MAASGAGENGRYVHARQFKRVRREQKRLKTLLGRVIRDDVGRVGLFWIETVPKENRVPNTFEVFAFDESAFNCILFAKNPPKHIRLREFGTRLL